MRRHVFTRIVADENDKGSETAQAVEICRWLHPRWRVLDLMGHQTAMDRAWDKRQRDALDDVGSAASECHVRWTGMCDDGRADLPFKVFLEIEFKRYLRTTSAWKPNITG